MNFMNPNNNHFNSVNDIVGLSVDNVMLSSGSVEQAVQDHYQATVSLITGYPGQSSPNILQDNLSKHVYIIKNRSHQNACTNAKTKTKNSLNCGVLNARSINNKTESVVNFILEHHLDILCITELYPS